VGAPADVGAGEDLATQVGLGQLLEGELQNLEVIGRGVGGGVPGPQDRGKRLACLGQVAEQRVEAEAALVVAGGAFLLGVGDQKRGVDVEDQLLGPGSGTPCPGQRLGAGATGRFEQAGSIDFSTRWAVVSEATAPNSASWPRRTPRSET
jgi:hypothetical protein